MTKKLPLFVIILNIHTIQQYLALFNILKGIQFLVKTYQKLWIGQIPLSNKAQIPKYFHKNFYQIVRPSLLWIRLFSILLSSQPYPSEMGASPT